MDVLSSAINSIPDDDVKAVWPNAPQFREDIDLRLQGVSEWTVETLMRDSLAYGGIYGSRSLRNWEHFADVGNQLLKLENEIWQLAPSDDDAVLYELFRIAHRQFPWQAGLPRNYFARYLSLYSHPELSEVIEAEFSLSPKNIVRIVFGLFGLFSSQRAAKLPLDFSQLGIDNVAANRFVLRFATDWSSAHLSALQNSTPDINFAYRPSPFREKPLILVQQPAGIYLFCPVWKLMLERMIDGLFFDLVNRSDFSNAYGRSFQKYIFDVSRIMLAGKCEVLDEQRYGPAKQQKDSCDIIISDSSSDIFVECKTRRVSLAAKVDLKRVSTIADEMKKLSESIFQSYKTIHDALSGRYPHWQPKCRPTYLLLVLLSPWYISGPRLWQHVFEDVRVRLIAAGIPESIVSEAPVTVCSARDFETLSCVLREISIDRVFAGKTDTENSSWQMDTYLREHFSEVIDRQAPHLAPVLQPFEDLGPVEDADDV